MRLYYEALELLQENNEPEFIRADITALTNAEREEALIAIKDIMVGKDYKLTKHLCFHDECKGCEVKEI